MVVRAGSSRWRCMLREGLRRTRARPTCLRAGHSRRSPLVIADGRRDVSIVRAGTEVSTLRVCRPTMMRSALCWPLLGGLTQTARASNVHGSSWAACHCGLPRKNRLHIWRSPSVIEVSCAAASSCFFRLASQSPPGPQSIPASSLHHRRATHVSDLPNSPISAGPCVLCAPHAQCTTMVLVALTTQLTFWIFMVRWTHRIVMSEGRYYFRGPLLGSSENVPVLQFVREFESPRPIFESGLAAMLVRRSVLPESKPRSMHFLPFRGDGEMNVHPARKDERQNT